jgi:hypothetical protein
MSGLFALMRLKDVFTHQLAAVGKALLIKRAFLLGMSLKFNNQ